MQMKQRDEACCAIGKALGIAVLLADTVEQDARCIYD
jgi:hypothetical protein